MIRHQAARGASPARVAGEVVHATGSTRARSGRAREPRVLFGIALGIALAGGGCRVDEAKFDNRVFACDVAAPDPGCGTDSSGKPMACFAARQVGATDFCTKTCDPMQPRDGTVCLADSSIELASCDPTVAGSCGSNGLACYRTDLLTDQGVCTTMNPCSADPDCRDPIRSVCAATFLSGLYPQGSSVLKTSNLYCLQTGCKARGTSCSAGETCLQDVIPASANPPDICVPNCDSALRCPPNFLCYRKVSTPVAPSVCIPGLLGFTCQDGLDCMLGDCTANDIGYRVCTAPCLAEADCQRYDGIQGKFTCVKNNGIATNPGVCQTPDAYRGSICSTTADCTRNTAEICGHLDPTAAFGTCLLPCAADGRCPQRGGINHTCLQGADGVNVCFPGYFGYPCMGDDNCVGDLVCEATLPGQPNRCTKSCTADTDCTGARWIGGQSWCETTALHICFPAFDNGAACSKDSACKSGHCSTTTNQCVATGGT